MINKSIECQADIDCPGNGFCIRNLWFSKTEDGSGCMCARLYGWRGENCEEQGVGTIVYYLVTASFLLLAMYYFIKSLRILYFFLIQDLSQIALAVTKNKITGNTEDVEQQEVLQKKGNKFIRRNFFLLKAQILYLLIVLCFFLIIVTLSFLITAANPQGVYLDGVRRVPYGKRFRDWIIRFWNLFYFTAYSQLALTWLDIGRSATLSNKKYSMYFIWRFNAVRIAAYGILVFYLYRGRKFLAGRLEGTSSRKLLRQALLIRTCFKKLQISAACYVISSGMLAVSFLYASEFPLFLQMSLYPKPGGISYYMLLAQILRHTAIITLNKLQRKLRLQFKVGVWFNLFVLYVESHVI
eukprot:maker-scaffold_43-snap-gene-0.5-mRNA-1 protein AED:0.12 eAED:0.12 QI:81/0.33/0.25/1/1/1/4/0/353